MADAGDSDPTARTRHQHSVVRAPAVVIVLTVAGAAIQHHGRQTAHYRASLDGGHIRSVKTGTAA